MLYENALTFVPFCSAHSKSHNNIFTLFVGFGNNSIWIVCKQKVEAQNERTKLQLQIYYIDAMSLYQLKENIIAVFHHFLDLFFFIPNGKNEIKKGKIDLSRFFGWKYGFLCGVKIKFKGCNSTFFKKRIGGSP